MSQWYAPSIELLHERLAYNPETGDLTWRVWRSPNAPAGHIAGAVTGSYRHVSWGTGCRLKAHRVAWALHHGRWPKCHIDHIDGDGLNNRIANLREVTQGENMRNARQRVGASGARGVHRHGQKWRAKIQIGRRQILLGSFETIEEAKAAYRAGERKYHGEYAYGESRPRSLHRSLWRASQRAGPGRRRRQSAS